MSEENTFRTRVTHLILNMDPNTRAGLKAVYYCSKDIKYNPDILDDFPLFVLMDKTKKKNIEIGLYKKIETGIACVDNKETEEKKKEAYMKLGFGLRSPVIYEIMYESSGIPEQSMYTLERYAIILEEIKTLEKNYANLDEDQTIGKGHSLLQLVNSPDNVLGMLPPQTELDSMKRNIRERNAASWGAGSSNFMVFIVKYAATGNKKIPSRVIIFTAEFMPIKLESIAPSTYGSGK